MAAVSRLECAAPLLQPSLEFLTRHTTGEYNSCVALSTDVLCRTSLTGRGITSASVFLVDLASRVRRPSRSRATGSRVPAAPSCEPLRESKLMERVLQPAAERAGLGR